jgi:hypothetical protein
MRRTVPLVVSVAIAASVAALGLVGCGRGGPGSGPAGAEEVELTNLSWEAQALESIGYTVDQLGITDPAAQPTASPDEGRAHERRDKFRRLRYGFGRHVLHGEAVVRTDEGHKTVVVQRGEITAVTATTITVRSSDDFTLTWTLGLPLTVVKERKRVDKGVLAVGQVVGIAGAKEGEATKARLIIVPKQT